MMRKNTKKRKKTTASIHRCKYCGASVSIRHSSEISDRLRDSYLYVCSHYPQCSAYVRIRRGSNIPDGEMADEAVRQKRKEAHLYFDMLFQKGLLSRDECYLWLMNILQIPRPRAHIKYLGIVDCQTVIEKSIETLRCAGINIPNFNAGGQNHDDKRKVG